MVKRSIPFLLCFMLCIILCSQEKIFAADQKNNPIDQAFAKDFKQDITTASRQKSIAQQYKQAWHEELKHAVEWRKSFVHFKEDKALFDNYLKTTEELADLMEAIELQNWINNSVPPKDRFSYVGSGIGAETMARARTFREMTLRIINNVQDKRTYHYKYKGKGAEPEK